MFRSHTAEILRGTIFVTNWGILTISAIFASFKEVSYSTRLMNVINSVEELFKQFRRLITMGPFNLKFKVKYWLYSIFIALVLEQKRIQLLRAIIENNSRYYIHFVCFNLFKSFRRDVTNRTCLQLLYCYLFSECFGFVLSWLRFNITDQIKENFTVLDISISRFIEVTYYNNVTFMKNQLTCLFYYLLKKKNL